MTLVAESVHFDSLFDTIYIFLKNGATLSVSARNLPGLEDVSTAQLAFVELTPSKDAIYWEGLNISFSIDGLINGDYGFRGWLKQPTDTEGRRNND